MITLSDNASGARQAALLMHTLGEADRRWMLGQLDPAARAEAEQLLVELATLGVPSDPALLDAVLTRATRNVSGNGNGNGNGSGNDHGARSATTASTSAAGADLPLARLAQATVPEMVALLQNEPDALIACLLQHGRRAPAGGDGQGADWAWRTGLLDRLGPARRRRIGELLAEDAASSAASSGSASSPAAMSVRGARAADLVAARLARPSVDGRADASRGSHGSRSWGARLAQRLAPWSRR
ncbi:hypothetical protein CDL60_12935 [Roseateles noduli]|nr:hypothetical protein CDL60_12935 [Roseateles noduli]